MEIFRLFGSIFVDNEKANESIAKTDKKAEGLGKRLGEGIKTAAKWGAAIGAAASAAGAAMFAMANKAAGTTDRIDKLSQKIGLSRQGFQEWEFILSQNGTSIEQMQTGLKTLTQRMDETVKGTGKGAELFNQLGVSVVDATGKLKSQEQVFEETVRALQNMPDGAEKSRLAVELFGRAGQELMPLLNGAAGSVDELKAKAHELGLVISDDAIDAGVKFTDTMDQMKRMLGAVFTQIGVALIPMFQQLSEWVMTYMPQIRAIFSTVFRAIGFLVEGFIKSIQFVIEWVRQWVAQNEEQLNELRQKFEWLFKDIMFAIESFIAFAIDFWQKYGQNITEIFKIAWDIIRTTLSITLDLLMDIFHAFGALFSGDWKEFWFSIKMLLSDVWEGIKALLSKGVQALVDIFRLSYKLFFDAGKEMFEGLWEGLKQVFKGIANWISDKVGWIKDKLAFWKRATSSISTGGPNSSSNLPPGLAEGGTVLSPGRVLVGERGPEILELPRGATVTPLNKAGITININNPNILDDYGVDRLLDRIDERMAILGVK